MLRNHLKAIGKRINRGKCLGTRLLKNFPACFLKLDSVGYISIALSSLKVSTEKRLIRQLFGTSLRKQLPKAVP